MRVPSHHRTGIRLSGGRELGVNCSDLKPACTWDHTGDDISLRWITFCKTCEGRIRKFWGPFKTNMW